MSLSLCDKIPSPGGGGDQAKDLVMHAANIHSLNGEDLLLVYKQEQPYTNIALQHVSCM